jgi:hypothetical protein
MALHGTEREERYFATTLTSLCNVVRFDRDINFIDAAFTELFVLYREATPTERANLRALKVATKKALALHLAEYQVAVGQPDNLHWEAIFAVTPGAEAFMKTGDFAGEDFNDGDFQKRFASELLFAKLIRTFDAALHAEEPLESSLSEEALEELKARRDELKDKAWSIRIDGLLLSHISRILDNS